MQIIATRQIEDCLDGSPVMDLLLDGPVTNAEVQRLGTLGDLQYFPRFPRPMFIVNDPRRFKIKGLEGNSTARLIVYSNDVARALEAVAACLELTDNTTVEDEPATATATKRHPTTTTR